MEGVSLINLDELLPAVANKVLTDFAVKKYIVPQMPIDTYRVFYCDDSFEDFQAENAYEVKNMCMRDDVAKIMAFKVCYPEILSAKQHQIINASNAKLSSIRPLETNFHEYDLSRFNEPFELLDFQQYSVLYK